MVDGVVSAEVSYASQQAVVRGSASVAALIEAVDNVGFTASLQADADSDADADACLTRSSDVESAPDHILSVQGMLDPLKCPKNVIVAITAVDGVLDVRVDFDAETVKVWGFAEISPLLKGS
jgi:copper chaperone CopZ